MDDRADFFTALDREVQAAYLSEQEILEGLDDLADVHDLALTPALRAEATQRLRRAMDQQRQRESTWNERTVNDRITAAFSALGAAGILALEDAGYTQSEGWEQVRVASEGQKLRGAVFFHRQDVESALDGGILRLTFAASGTGEATNEAVARQVCEVLGEHGVETTWDGTVTSRIRLKPFEWRRRRFTKDPGSAPPSKPWWRVW
jgi:hypothetical protein